MSKELVNRFIFASVLFQQEYKHCLEQGYYDIEQALNGQNDPDQSAIQLYKETLTELFEDAIDEIKSEIKLEMRMEMHMEIEKLKDLIAESSKSPAQRGWDGLKESRGVGCGRGRGYQFDLRSNNVNGKPSNKPTFASMPLSSGFASDMNRNMIPDFSDSELPQLTVDDLLKDNPLFQRVSTNLENIRSGKAVNKVDDFKRKVFDDEAEQNEYDDQREKLRAYELLHSSFMVSNKYEDEYRQKHNLDTSDGTDVEWYKYDYEGYSTDSNKNLEVMSVDWSVSDMNRNGLQNHGKDWIPIVDPLEDTEDIIIDVETANATDRYQNDKTGLDLNPVILNEQIDKYHNDQIDRWLNITTPAANNNVTTTKKYTAEEEIQKRIAAGDPPTAEEIDQYEKIQAYIELCASEYNQEDDDEDAKFMELCAKNQSC